MITSAYAQLTFTFHINNRDNQQELEEFIDACSECGALAVSIEEALLEDNPDEMPVYSADNDNQIQIGWQHSKVIVLLDNKQSIDEFIHEVKNFTQKEIANYNIEYIEDKEWVRITQSQFDPIIIGKKLAIIPSWHLPLENLNNIVNIQNRIIINLDPGLAFGTGSHPTTNLCLQWLEQLEQDNIAKSSILDYGCGSGILSIVAHKLGISEAIGVDIDEKAIEAANYNSSNNKANCKFFHTDDIDWINYKHKQFDIVIANILSNPLKLMAALLTSKVANNGYLVLSGILARQADEIKHGYKNYIALEVNAELEGWVCMVGKKLIL